MTIERGRQSRQRVFPQGSVTGSMRIFLQIPHDNNECNKSRNASNSIASKEDEEEVDDDGVPSTTSIAATPVPLLCITAAGGF